MAYATMLFSGIPGKKKVADSLSQYIYCRMIIFLLSSLYHVFTHGTKVLGLSKKNLPRRGRTPLIFHPIIFLKFLSPLRKVL